MSWEDEVDGHWASFVGKAGDSSGREVCRDCSLLGFFSDSRHDFICLWAQALDAATKRPRGGPVAVFHAHGSPWRVNFPRGFSFTVGRDRIVFNAAEITGNVLMGQLLPD